MNKHILLIPTNYPSKVTPTAGIFFNTQANALAKFGHKVGVISVVGLSLSSWLSTSFYQTNNLFTVLQTLIPSIPKLRKTNYWFRTQVAKLLLKKYISKHGKPDVIHVHVYSAAGVAIWAKKHLDIPYVITEHYSHFANNQLNSYQLAQAKLAYENADKCLAVSESLANTLNKLFNIQFKCIPNVVDSLFKYDELIKKPQEKFILNVAGLNKNKNHHRLIQSYSLITNDFPNIKLVIAGDGPLKQELQEFIDKLNLTSKVSLIGTINKQQVCKLMQQAEIFALSSDYETFGVVLIESLACGTPVIACNVGGIPEIITSNKLGYLSDTNVENYAQALKLSLQTDYNKQQISAETRLKYGENALYQDLNSVYNSLIIDQIN